MIKLESDLATTLLLLSISAATMYYHGLCAGLAVWIVLRILYIWAYGEFTKTKKDDKHAS